MEAWKLDARQSTMPNVGVIESARRRVLHEGVNVQVTV
jgi:hypothetical protein